ncbi:exopolysaccharide biosynthesis protein [Roseitranquillus sediminis]|uniref:exopolysaccharide biosynthesis protein n=1 Tax=Roseitranquillus sediminis TaxID=2809051 RepID=UPI002221F60C|nr:exopolysaccharide biosynthesis protein [Roseitranquillus sediminis]
MLARGASDAQSERIAIGELIGHFGHRAFGALILFFAAPNCIPIPLPGLSFLFGMPLLLLSLQMALGRDEPWLPRFIRVRSIQTVDYRRIVGALRKPLDRIERLIRPRLLPVTSRRGERVLGLFGITFALVLFLPLPFGNAVPGLGLALIGIGTVERDGLAALIGVAIGLAGLVIVAGAAAGLVLAGLALVTEFFL